MHSDPIADLLTRIRNATRANHLELVVPFSTIKMDILEIMKQKKTISDYKVNESGQFKQIDIELIEGKRPTLIRSSKPGQRIYIKKDEIKTIKSNLSYFLK